LKIIRDFREQRSFLFFGEKYEGVEDREGSLTSGDFSIIGFESRVAVERESLLDLMASISTGLDAFMVAVEAPFSDVVTGNYWSRMNPKVAVA